MRNLLKRLPKSFGSAAFQVALIFLGVTLAIGFGNWNTARLQKQEELELLLELKKDLELNISLLEQMNVNNAERADRIGRVLDHLERREPETGAFRADILNLTNWNSPYLSRGTYETIKSRGMHLISDREIRSGLIRLYENSYTTLKDDVDRTEWVNYEVSAIPQFLKYVEQQPDGQARIYNYQGLLNDDSFRIAFARTRAIRRSNILQTSESIEATRELLALVDAALPKGQED